MMIDGLTSKTSIEKLGDITARPVTPKDQDEEGEEVCCWCCISMSVFEWKN
jgi:hypothetical protein